MTMSSDPSKRTQAQQQVIDRASSDPDFRSHLLENPKEALSEQFGASLPPTLKVRVMEEQPGEVILVLPARHMRSGTALTEADLEKAAGGNWYSWVTLNASCIG